MIGFYEVSTWAYSDGRFDIRLTFEPATNFEPYFVVDSNFLPTIRYAVWEEDAETYQIIEERFVMPYGERETEVIVDEASPEEVPELINNA